MGVFDWLRTKKKELSLNDVRRQEKHLEIRENRTLNNLEKLEKEREELFAKGSKVKNPMKRRQLARLYNSRSAGLKMMERELQMLSKELTTISAVKMAMERKEMKKDGVAKLLNRLNESELIGMLESEKITNEMYMEKLDVVLGTVTDGAHSIMEDLGSEGNEVMQIWEKMDEGEIDNFDDALKIADRAVRKRESEAQLEAE